MRLTFVLRCRLYRTTGVRHTDSFGSRPTPWRKDQKLAGPGTCLSQEPSDLFVGPPMPPICSAVTSGGGVAMKANSVEEDRPCAACVLRAVDPLAGLADRWAWEERAPRLLHDVQRARQQVARLLVDVVAPQGAWRNQAGWDHCGLSSREGSSGRLCPGHRSHTNRTQGGRRGCDHDAVSEGIPGSHDRGRGVGNDVARPSAGGRCRSQRWRHGARLAGVLVGGRVDSRRQRCGEFRPQHSPVDVRSSRGVRRTRPSRSWRSARSSTRRCGASGAGCRDRRDRMAPDCLCCAGSHP